MSAPRRKTYRFATAAQWATCFTHRFDVRRDGSLSPMPRLALRASAVSDGGPVSTVAVDPHGTPVWRRDRNADPAGFANLFRLDNVDGVAGPFEIEGALARSPRWIIDRDWIWAFAPGESLVHRYERDTLQHDLAVDVGATIRDLAADGKQGVWLLVDAAAGKRDVLRIDCEGRRRERHPVPPELCSPCQLGSVQRGTMLTVLEGDGNWLLFMDPRTGARTRLLNIGNLAICWSALRLTTDACERIALLGVQALSTGAQGTLFVLDASGDTVDGPLAANATSLAIHGDVIWLGTDAGLFKLGAGEGEDARESDSTLLTPVLRSPDSDPIRGWLRAEVFVALPRGSVLEAEFVSTDKANVIEDVKKISGDRSATAEQKQQAIWSLFEPDPARRFRFTGPTSADQPIAIPLFSSRDPWLLLRLNLMTPPGTPPQPLTELRVLYPDASIAQHLPAAFRGERKDPTGFMRRLVGVLESTSQRLDDRIGSIGSYVDPSTAPAGWRDYLARWLDLPWDDGLPDEAKKQLLIHAGELLDQRGTRAGLRTLLRCLVGQDTSIQIEDVTVEHTATFLNADGRPGGRLPALLAGTCGPVLGEKAVLGRARLCANSSPLDVLAPTLRIGIVTSAATRRAVEPFIERILVQYIPAGVRIRVRWPAPAFGSLSEADGLVIDANGPGLLGRDSVIGRTVVAGRRGRLDDCGLSFGFTLR